MESRKRQRKNDSTAKTLISSLVAIAVMVCAVFVLLGVYRRIKSDYQSIDFSKPSESPTQQTLAIENEKIVGWYETEEGFFYYTAKDEYLKDTWKEIDGFLYHFGEDGVMTEGDWSENGQKFTLSKKGYVKNIQTDPSWEPESASEMLDSLVKADTYFVYLGEADGVFKPILYRKAADTKVIALGGEENPEETTRNSLRADGDYVYYLPKVKSTQTAFLTEKEREVCDKLFRFRPGEDQVELIAEDVDGYLIVEGVIYYAQGGSLHRAVSGKVVDRGDSDSAYQVIVRDKNAYLADGEGKIVTAKSGTTITLGDRIYRIETDGKIQYVKHAEESVGGYTYSLSTVSGSYLGILRENAAGSQVVAQEKYGVQSYCIVDNSIYYSAYVDYDANGVWYSQIFRTALDGSGKTALGNRFYGMVGNMYAFGDEGIYGEYHPTIWKNGYGVIVNIKKDGSLYRIKDESLRAKKTTSGNDMMELVMVTDGTVSALWHDTAWSKNVGITATLWSEGVQMSANERVSVGDGSIFQEKEEETQPETTTAPQTTEQIIVLPVEETSAPQTQPATTQEAIETLPIAPETDAAQTVSSGNDAPTTAAPTDEVIIQPIN